MSLLWVFLLLVALNKTNQSYVEGFETLDKSSFGPKTKGTVKTIEALECGDIIDYVDFYKQPAFDNPNIIKDLKMVPSSFPSWRFNKTRSHEPKLIQTWHKYGECPKGTVRIRRTLENKAANRRKNDGRKNHEYATAYQFIKNNGAQAKLNLWHPQVEASKEMSLSQIWVGNGANTPDANTIEAGWMVHPSLYHDHKTRLFIFWTSDNYNRTGCYNTICLGFVKTSNNLALGAALEPISVYKGEMFVIGINILRTREGDWSLEVGDENLGYFPRSLFTRLGDGATELSFGGEIVNVKLGNRHTNTEMGNGHFSGERFRQSSFISNIKLADKHFKWVDPTLKDLVTNPTCYDLTFGPPRTRLGSHFYFGGPGLHSECP